MKIWFDISNSPHVNLFLEMMKELEWQGHELIITSRPLANTIELLNQYGIQHTPIGIHYGKNMISKTIGYPIRVFKLWRYLLNKKVDAAVSQSSFHSPLTAFLLGIPSLYTNDNEHADGNLIGFLFAKKLLLPNGFSIRPNWIKSITMNKVKFYPGVKEGIFLWRKEVSLSTRSNLNDKKKLNIYIRPEPATAQYYQGELNFLDDFIEKLQVVHQVTILVRSEEQRKHFTSERFMHCHLPNRTLTIDSIIRSCDLFIGAGGSMTREMAILGIPTISVYQDKLLGVDKKLIDANAMIHIPKLTLPLFNQYVSQLNGKRSSVLLNQGKSAYTLFLSEINNLK